MRALHDADESIQQYVDKDKIITVADDTAIQQANYLDRKTDGFSLDRAIRRVARIYMPTVRLLAHNGDIDAKSYLEYGDSAARDRMIERYPELFKTCSGR